MYSCDTCRASFHFKKDLHRHLIWSQTCGILKGLESDEKFEICTSRDSLVSKVKQEVNERGKSKNDKNLNEKLSVVRLNVTEKTSIILVNCENMLDKEFYVKRSKRSKCGICSGCELTSDCLTCSVCNKSQAVIGHSCQELTMESSVNSQKTTSSFRKCLKRKCINPIFNVS